MPWDKAVRPARPSDADGSSTPPPAQAPVPAGEAQYERHGAWVVVAHDTYDMDSIKPLAEVLSRAAGAYPRLVLDASGLTFADSSFLNLLLRTHQAAELCLAAPGPQLRRLLQLAGVDGILRVRPTVEEAARA